MNTDPFYNKFIALISLFSFFMIFLISGSSLLFLFIGFEFIGIVSFLLISHWYTRSYANKNALFALISNRISDYWFSILLYLLIIYFLSTDYNIFNALISYYKLYISEFLVFITILRYTYVKSRSIFPL